MGSIIDRFFDIEKNIYPGAEYRDKSKVFTHRLIGWYSKPFNPDYSTWVTTTVHPRTDFGSEVIKHPMTMLRVELHENVHKWDFQHGPRRAMLKYLFPQLYAIPFIVAALVLAGWVGLAGLWTFLILGHVGLIEAHSNLDKDGKVTSKGMKFFAGLTGIGALCALGSCIVGAGWWSLLLGAGALFLSPWPLKARWRVSYELRGYVATLYQEWLRHGNVRPEALENCVKQFTGSTYFFMETDKKQITARLQHQISRFTQEESRFLDQWHDLGTKPPSTARGILAAHKAAEPYRMMSDFISREHLRNVEG